MRIRWNRQAKQDLKEIKAYIARDSRIHALRTVQRIRESTNVLRRCPESGSLVAEDELQLAREMIVGNYRVIYQVVDEEVHVFTVVHASRDLSTDDFAR